MTNNSEVCNDKTMRRRDIRQHRGPDGNPDVNGIDYIEIDENDQRKLYIHFLDKAPENIKEGNVRIDGGRRVRNIQVKKVQLCDPHNPDQADCMEVIVDKAGDFSTYRLCIVQADEHGRPTSTLLPGFDQRYSCSEFSFKADCPSDLDCLTDETCPPPVLVEPEIDYLAKDYASFRQLILDRLSLIMPDWREQHIPDIGITLVEILAYAGDYLSYYQDAVATEAYLGTARQRISVRRHTRLVDYQMHEGCNSRAWLFLETSEDISLDPQDIYFITGNSNTLSVDTTILSDFDVQKIPAENYDVFEPLLVEPALLLPDEIKDPKSLALKLRDAKDLVSGYLRRQFSIKTQQLLDKYDGSSPLSDELMRALVAELNRLIQFYSLYDKQRFAHVQLSDETKRLIAKMEQVGVLPVLNRLLLDDSYPQEIARSQGIHLSQAHNEISFYTWGDTECCLPRGATTATLRDDWAGEIVAEPEVKQQGKPSSTGQPQERPRKLHLQVGDMLFFEEMFGPKTGLTEDANPAHRHIVRLTRVELAVDGLYDIPVVEIEWGPDDALPFPLCLSTIGPAQVPVGSPPDSVVKYPCQLLEDVSIARGNMILVDYGKTIAEDLGTVPGEPTLPTCESVGTVADVSPVAGVFRPVLRQAPLTFYEPLAADAPFFHPQVADPSASVALTSSGGLLLQDPRQAVPSITLLGIPPAVQPTNVPGEDEDEDDETEVEGEGGSLAASQAIEWIAQRDLLENQPDDYVFTVEMDNEGFAHLRFGDGELGRMPEAGTVFKATYRTGNGLTGNVGAETITRIVFRNTLLSGITLQPRNPFAATGGTDPEPLTEVKLFAPHAFRASSNLQRAITADDFARLAQQNPKVQRAAAALRWTGSWFEVLVAIDPYGSEGADQSLLDEIAAYLERYRRMGYDLQVVAARYVALDIAMTICVQPNFLQGHVKAALLDIFSNRVLAGGRLGFFHPDNLTFGQGIALSKLVAVAQAVPGVQSVTVTRLQRLFDGPNGELQQEFLPIGPREIAQLDNDRSFPEQGIITFKMVGGR